jgi:type IX secretion system PorP/SprF family membrane protein
MAALLGAWMCAAQDIHFSQVDADPVLLNPAYSGFYEGLGRFGVVYRNQWASVSVPFSTLAASGEMAVWRGGGRRGLSVGGTLFADKAGTLNYGTVSGHLSTAYYQALNRSGSSVLSVGVEVGWAQSGFDPSQAEMEEAGEGFEVRKVHYPLLAAGLAWYCQPTPDFHLKAGLSLRNLNRPNISYMKLDETYLARRYSLFARAEYRCWQSISLLPVLMSQMQGKHRGVVFGGDVKWYIEEGGSREVSLRAGVAMRAADALIANLMLEYNSLLFTFSYDANISGLAVASGGMGAFEAGLVYRLAKGNKKTKALKCPQY